MKIALIAGARPNFVKAAPLLAALARQPECESILIHTGQHYDQEMVVADLVADRLFTPTEEDGDNLRNAGISEEEIHFTGNVMADALLGAHKLAAARRAWRRWGLAEGAYGVLALHRVANVDDPATLARLLDAAGRVAGRIPLVFPVHPRTRRRLAEADYAGALERAPRLVATEPLGHLDFVSLLGGARLVLTDSGGVQAEATILGVPCVTLRERTEWPVTVALGGNQLAGTDPERALAGLSVGRELPPRWDGHAADRIAEVVMHEPG